ncbi:MAG TPA: hypothetical protein VFW28_04390 [Micropepsaceae bacterium]|nr:hypothetical protein [Micropepsaceae bacterium]
MKTCFFVSALVAVIAPTIGNAQNAIPDFTGVWGRSVFNLEPTGATGPQPLRNLRRAGTLASEPIVVGDPVPLVGDYMNPILRPEAAAVVKQRGEMSAAGHDFPDPSNQCAVYSPPYLFSIQLGMQLLQRKDEVVILYNNNQQVRHVRLNATHPRNLKPTATGDSVGHYEGDTLVVDTAGIKVMPWTTADRFGTPQSDMMHVIERYHLVTANEARDALTEQEKRDGCVCGGEGRSAFIRPNGAARIDEMYDEGLRVEVRVEDPKVFTTPWTANVTYMHVRRDWAETVCAENNTDVLHQGFEHVPTATAPDF